MTRFMLDSGAFTASKKEGGGIDIDEYIEFIKENEDLFDYCINLDHIPRTDGKDKNIDSAKQSYHNWLYIRKAGVNALPVFHLGTDERWLERYLKKTDYIGIGAIANMNTNQRLLGLTRVWKDYLVDSHLKPKVKIHGLGLTAVTTLLRYPWYSVDSSSPARNASFGQIYVPNLTKGLDHPQYFKLTTMKVSDQAIYTVGKKNFLTFPRKAQEQYTEFFEKHGFELGMITYQQQRPRRSLKLRREDPPKFNLLKPLDKPTPEKRTLANNSMLRYRWNLHVWKCLINRLPSYDRILSPATIPKEELTNINKRQIVYVVISTTKYLKVTLECKPKFNLLISYAYMNKTQLETLKTHR